jgi:hypothetical protein
VHLCTPQVESSLATEYPSLLSLGVASGYDKYNEDTAPEALVGLYKVLPNKQWPSGKVVSEGVVVLLCFRCQPLASAVLQRHSRIGAWSRIT